MRVEVAGLRLDGPTRGPLARGLDLVLEPGATLLVAGGSGSGKTLLLKALAGSCPLLAGSIRRSPKLRMGLSLARGGLLVNQTLLQNLMLPLRFQGLRKEAATAQATEVLACFGLGALAEQRPHALSDRQRKLGSLARVAAFDPDLVLLDEPFEGLDARDLPLVRGVLAAWAGDPLKGLVVATERPGDHGDLQAARLDLDEAEETP